MRSSSGSCYKPRRIAWMSTVNGEPDNLSHGNVKVYANLIK